VSKRRALYVVGFAASASLAIFAAGLASQSPAAQGAAESNVERAPDLTWEELMGQSVKSRKAGAIRESKNFLERATALANTFGPRDMRRAHTRMGLAEFLLWTGDPVAAEAAYKDAVEIGETAGGPANPDLISLLEGLANFYYYRERYEEAAPIMARILQIVRSASVRDPHEEARRLRNLAQVHQLRGHHEQATPLHLEALKLVEASPLGSPAEIAEYLHAAAECYLAWGKAKLAEPLAIRALESMEADAGPETLGVVPYLETLAEVHVAAGEPARAVPLYRRAIVIVEAVYGTEHADLAPFLQGLGDALRAQGKIDEANEHIARARGVTAWRPPAIAPTRRDP
jgi:tetratricopeptide (TPR) repeat protein